MSEGAGGCSDERVSFRSFVSRLTWMTGDFELLSFRRKAEGRGDFSRPQRPGFLIHSLLGLGLRAVGCMESPRCDSSCRRPHACPYGLLMEPRPSETGVPLAGVARAPSPVIVDAPWSLWTSATDLRFRLNLLGNRAGLRGRVDEALAEGLAGASASIHYLLTVKARGWSNGSVYAKPANSGHGSKLKIALMSPLRLVRSGSELETFDLASVVRDLTFRLAVWGHQYQDSGWPAVWRFLWEDARAAAIARADTRTVRFHRYSGRQEKAIPMKGLLGVVELEKVSSDLTLLLRFGAICGIGKGATIGLGRIRIDELQ